MTVATHGKTVTFLRTYRFRKDEKDPVIDQIRTIMDDVGYNTSRAAKDSGVSPTTIYNWMDGPTKRPQYATCCAVIRALGYDFAIVPANKKANGHSVAASMPKIIKRFRVAGSAE